MATTAPSIAFDPGAEDHAPDLYQVDGLAETIDGFAAFDEDAVRHYEAHGYVLIRGAFSGAVMDAAREGLSHLIAGRGKQTYELMFEASVKDRIDTLTDDQREVAIRKVFRFHGADDRLDAIMQHPDLLASLERLGLDRPRLYQSMALLKGPGGREKPWHQDRAYFNTPIKDRVVGVWIAVDEATPENGCMHLIPGRLDPVIHWKRRDWQICDTDIRAMPKRVVAAAMRPGDALLFDSMIPHGTPTNRTRQRRRALQFHYASAESDVITTEQRLAIFGSEGKDVTC